MKCSTIDTMISLFLDGRLDPERTKRLEEHCARCERCAGRLAERRSIEERARRIRPQQPPEEYWRTFSSRVAERIEAEGKRRAAFGLGRVLAGIFSLPAARPRLAAVAVSVAVIAVLGILYIGRWGGDIVPPRTTVRVGGGSRPGTAEREQPAEKKSIEEAQPAEQSPADQPRSSEGESVPPQPDRSRAAGQVPPIVAPAPEPGKAPIGEAVRIRDDHPEEAAERTAVNPRGEAAGEAAADRRTETAGEAAGRAEVAGAAKGAGQADEAQRNETAGGASESAAEKRKTSPAEKQRISLSEREPVRAPDTTALAARLTRERAARALDKRNVKSATTGMTRAQPAAEADRYDLDGTIVPTVTEDDTTISGADLRMLIRTWTAYLERNPHDPLVRTGYLQTATAYYLLARLTRDEAVIAEGSDRVGEYAARTDDRDLKDLLLGTLRRIEALRGR